MSHFARALLTFGALALSACASTPSRVANPSRGAPPDVRGDALALLPQGAVLWGRVDAAALRASPHYEQGMALARDLGADFALVERELGFDPFRSAERVAVAVYLPPGRDADAGWPLVYARGGFQREAVLAAARQRLGGRGEAAEASEQGMRYTLVGERAYAFPAPDVMLVMDRALVRRVAARLAGESPATVLTDERFAELWRKADGMGGAVVFAADLAAMRGRVRMDVRSPEADALDAVVAHGDAPGAVTVRAAGLARDAAAARMVVRTVDDARNETAGQLGVRLLGLSRLLREGVRAEADGRFVRASVDASPDEARRLLRASALLRELTQ